MTLEDLKKLREQYETATPGKWKFGSGYEQSSPGNYIYADQGRGIIAAEQDNTDCVLRYENAIHIISAHNAFQELIELAEEALKVREIYAGRHAYMGKFMDNE